MRVTSKNWLFFITLMLVCLLSIDGAFTSRASAQFGDPGARNSGGFGGGNGTGGTTVTFVQRFDRDGDGRVSREEFDGPPERFDILDRNKDGYLTEDEKPSLPPLVNGRPAYRQNVQGNPSFTSEAQKRTVAAPENLNSGGFSGGNGPGGTIVTFVQRFDRDGDGRVSREEFSGSPGSFDNFDRNHDGYLTEDERPPLLSTGNSPSASRQNVQVSPAVTPGVQQRAVAAPDTRNSVAVGVGNGTGGTVVTFVQRFDRDGDGRVSREEFGASPGSFDNFDRNHDGYLSEEERPPLPSADNSPSVSRQDMQVSPAAISEVQQKTGAVPASKEGAATFPWLKTIFLFAVAALLLSLAWGLHASRRFSKVKKAVESLDPHLLAVNIDRNIMITEVTEALCKATGFRFKDLVGKPLMALGSHISDNPTAMQDMWNKIQTGTAWKGEVKLVRKNGSVLWADAVISPSRRKKEKSSAYTVFYQDISQRKHFESLSMRDELTTLFNRRYFNRVAPRMLQKTRRDRHLFVLCILDVDNFKAYNDTYGHPAGDRVLAAIGRQLTAVFQRRDDLLFRLGGEEFGVIILIDDRNEAVTTANKILGAIRELKIDHKKNPPGIVTVSIGLRMVYADDNDDVETVYKKADQALYEAKQSGRNRCVVSK